MRWLIEISRVGDASPADRYCVDANQWQQALQQARSVRGEVAPLSALSIELLGEGYRATDAALNLRYLINKAPRDAPLTAAVAGDVAGRTQSSHSSPSRVASATVASDDNGGAGSPRSAIDAGAPSAEPNDPTMSSRAATNTSRISGNPASGQTTDAPRPSKFPPAALVTPLPTGPISGPDPAENRPGLQLIHKRETEPSEDNPVTVREYAYAVEAGTSREKVGFLLWSRFREVAASLQDRNKGKLIELSIYDHVFEGNPGGAPLATLVWKDWRGGPVAEFPGFAATSVPPAPASETSLAEAPASSGAPPQEPQKPQEPQEPEDGRGAPPEPGPESAPISSDAAPFELVAPNAAHSPAAATPAAELDLPLDTGALEAMLEAGPQPSQRSPSRRAFDISGEHPIARVSSPPASAAPVSARKAGEDLLDDLFDVMHELRFAGDLIAGAEFVAEVLGRVLPSELTLVHVFDIDAREFVTVRATGTGSERALLQRASERDALLFETMRARRAVSAAAPSDARLRCERFVRCGVEARSVACAGVQWQGRYLGALELVNPLDGGGFERGDLNALDYVSEQFAEFAANHSIVLDQESVLRPRFR